jgi:hypothetical protein
MLPTMIAITTAELERRIHRFEVGMAKLEQLSQTPQSKQVGEKEAIESNLKAFQQELADMRQLHAERVAGGQDASTAAS